MDIIEQPNYKDALKRLLLDGKRRFGQKYSFQELAKACRVQKTYLSKVLNHKGDLSEDQLYLAGNFLKLNDDDHRSLFLLYQRDRSQIIERKKALENEIKTIKKSKLRTEAHLDTNNITLQASDLSLYFTSPILQVIHMGLTIRRFANDTEKLREALKLSRDNMNMHLAELEKLQIIQYRNERYHVLLDNLHLPDDHPLFPTYRSMIRMRAAERLNSISADQRYSFSVIFSADAETKKQIHQNFLSYLKSVKKSVSNAKDEEIYQMNFDLFDWT